MDSYTNGWKTCQHFNRHQMGPLWALFGSRMEPVWAPCGHSMMVFGWMYGLDVWTYCWKYTHFLNIF